MNIIPKTGWRSRLEGEDNHSGAAHSDIYGHLRERRSQVAMSLSSDFPARSNNWERTDVRQESRSVKLDRSATNPRTIANPVHRKQSLADAATQKATRSSTQPAPGIEVSRGKRRNFYLRRSTDESRSWQLSIKTELEKAKSKYVSANENFRPRPSLYTNQQKETVVGNKARKCGGC